MGGGEGVQPSVWALRMVGFLNKFNPNAPEIVGNQPLVNKFLSQDILDKIGSSATTKVVKDTEILDYTLREVVQEIGPLALRTAVLNNLNIATFKALGSGMSALFLYHSLCKGHEYLNKHYSPASLNYSKLSPAEKIEIERLWQTQSKRFRYIAAPLLAITLYTNKQVAFSASTPIKINIPNDFFNPKDQPQPHHLTDIWANCVGEKGEGGINKSLLFLGFFKKLPDFIGKIVIFLILCIFIKFILNAYSIQLLDPYYIKIYCVLGSIVCFIIALDYLVKLIIYSYFKKDVDVIIPNKLPKKVYDYFNHLKILSKIEEVSLEKIFFLNFVLYFVLVLILICLFILI